MCHSQKNNMLLPTFLNRESWVVRGDTILPGFPQKPYTLGFSKDVAKIDAAFHNGIVLLF